MAAAGRTARAYRSMKDNLPINEPLFLSFDATASDRPVESNGVALHENNKERKREEILWAAMTASRIDYQREKRVRERKRKYGWHGSRRSFCLFLLLCSALLWWARELLAGFQWTMIGLTCSRSGGSGWINRLV